MNSSNNPKYFSIKIAGVSYQMQDLQNLGSPKLISMRNDNKKLKKEVAKGAVFPFLMLAAYVVNDFVMHSSFNPHDGLTGLAEGALFSGVAGIGIKFLQYSNRAKQLDKSIVMVTGDMALAEFSSTKKDLVAQAYFQETRVANKSTYQSVIA